MKLWTIQPIKVIEILETKGYYLCDISKSEYCNNNEFVKAYEWMVSMMDERGILRPQENVSFPIWAWHTRDWKQKRPDYILTEFVQTKDGMMVCIELEVPDSQVLLSDYNLWNFVLNDIWLDDSQCESDWEEKQKWYNMQMPEVQKMTKRDSWKRIFDLRPLCTEWREVGRDIQGVFWKLKRDMIMKKYYFIEE